MVGRKLSFVTSPNTKPPKVPKTKSMHDFVLSKSFSKLDNEVSTGLILSKLNIYKTTMKSTVGNISKLFPLRLLLTTKLCIWWH
ncbi:hypothetical protein P8452_56281 [Trifolium repens]|nr:hypothetical protein P8452_56281 [Trifolium repens]